MITDILERTKRLVAPEIEKYLKDPVYPTQFAIPKKFSKEVELYWKINKVYPKRRGKYLRPTLTLLMAECLGAKTQKAIKVAGAMQLSEEWILIHDDIEDHSLIRRNGPTLHKMFGEELALNAGDSLHIIMWKMINDIKEPRIAEEFYKMLLRTALGQGVEQIWTNGKKAPNQSEYFFVADSKSAYYSIAGPMRLGAIIAGGTKDQIDKITDFGLHLGRCFQLVDDILDYEQDQKEGKKTLATLNGIDFARKLATTEKNKAKEILKKLTFLSKEPALSRLTEVTDFILDRSY